MNSTVIKKVSNHSQAAGRQIYRQNLKHLCQTKWNLVWLKNKVKKINLSYHSQNTTNKHRVVINLKGFQLAKFSTKKTQLLGFCRVCNPPNRLKNYMRHWISFPLLVCSQLTISSGFCDLFCNYKGKTCRNIYFIVLKGGDVR